MSADCHERHRREKEQQASSKKRLWRIREKEALFKISFRRAFLMTQITEAVNCSREKKRAGDAQEQQARSIERQPCVEHRSRANYPASSCHAGVQNRSQHQKRAAQLVGPN